MPSIEAEAIKKTVLVFGATGQQGGAVAAALRQNGWAVRALVRDPKGEKANALAMLGVEIFQGDFSNEASIRSAMDGAYGVFSVQPSSGQGAAYGVTDDDEIRYGKLVADIAVDAGVRHLVYTSINVVGSEKTGMGHFDSKLEIEAYIRDLPIKSTVVRPSGFMELMMLPGMGLDKGIFTFFLRPNQVAQTIAVQDIGKIVAAIFADPERYAGRTISIAGDKLSGTELEEKLSRAAGKPIAYHRFPDDLLQQNEFLGRLAGLFDNGRLSGDANLQSLNKEFGKLTSFVDWLDGPGKELFDAALRTGGGQIALR